MARQQFEQGQRVYIKRYGNTYIEAQVVKPDVVQTSYGTSGREMHYVIVRYVRDDKPDGNEWPVLNNRQMIILPEAYAEIGRGREIDRLRAKVRQHERWEEAFVAYAARAKNIIGLVQSSAGRADVLELLVALQLKGAFEIRHERRQLATEEVAKVRAEYKAEADEARQALEELGADVPPWGVKA